MKFGGSGKQRRHLHLERWAKNSKLVIKLPTKTRPKPIINAITASQLKSNQVFTISLNSSSHVCWKLSTREFSLPYILTFTALFLHWWESLKSQAIVTVALGLITILRCYMTMCKNYWLTQQAQLSSILQSWHQRALRTNEVPKTLEHCLSTFSCLSTAWCCTGSSIIPANTIYTYTSAESKCGWVCYKPL